MRVDFHPFPQKKMMYYPPFLNRAIDLSYSFAMWNGTGCVLCEQVTSVAWPMTASKGLPTSLRPSLLPWGSCSLNSILMVCVAYWTLNPNQQCCSARPNTSDKYNISCTIHSYLPSKLHRAQTLRQDQAIMWSEKMLKSDVLVFFFFAQIAPLCCQSCL